jgi:hypothetical protein
MTLPLLDPYTAHGLPVSTPLEAAIHVANNYGNNSLANQIDKALLGSKIYKNWRKEMPTVTPEAIKRYQTKHKTADNSAVEVAINRYGHPLSPDQYLFHGGVWVGDTGWKTTRPLSTSLCPQVAFVNALWNAKAYDAGRLDLFVLRVTAPLTKAFILRPKGSGLGHEREVLLAGACTMTLVGTHVANPCFSVGKAFAPDINIPINVLEVDVL